MDYRVKCPHCETETRFPLSQPFWHEGIHPAQWFTGERSSANDGRHELGPAIVQVSRGHGTHEQKLTACTSVCPECKGPAILTFLATGPAQATLMSNATTPGHIASYEGHPLRFVEVFPRSKMRTDFADAPPKVGREFPAAMELAAQGKAPAMVISACGSCLEELLKALEAKALANGWMTAPLKASLRLVDRIDALRDAGIITRDVADWAHTLRLDRNDSVHELEATPERAREFVHFIQFLIEAAFSMPARLNRLRPPVQPPVGSQSAA